MKQFEHGADSERIKAKYRIERLLDYSANINIFTPSGVAERLNEIRPQELAVYPDIAYTALRQKLSKKYAVDAERIIVGNGSTEIMFLLTRLGEVARVGAIQPTFAEYHRACRVSGKEAVSFYYDKEFKIDLDRIDLDRVDLLFVCNPNNPSGSSNDLSELIRRAQQKNVLVAVDETFMDFVGDSSRSAMRYLDRCDNLIVIKALTKFYALTGVRLGYAFSSKHLIAKLWAIKEPWTVNAFAERLVDVIFDEQFEKRSVAFYREETAWMKAELDKLEGLFVYPSESNFFLIRLPERWTAERFKERLILDHEILIRDCSNFDGLDAHHIRVNIKERSSNERLIEAIRKEVYNG